MHMMRGISGRGAELDLKLATPAVIAGTGQESCW